MFAHLHAGRWWHRALVVSEILRYTSSSWWKCRQGLSNPSLCQAVFCKKMFLTKRKSTSSNTEQITTWVPNWERRGPISRIRALCLSRCPVFKAWWESYATKSSTDIFPLRKLLNVKRHQGAPELDVSKVAMVELDGEPCRVRFTDEASGPTTDRWRESTNWNSVVSYHFVFRDTDVENCVHFMCCLTPSTRREDQSLMPWGKPQSMQHMSRPKGRPRVPSWHPVRSCIISH